jgi:hypothetical protein
MKILQEKELIAKNQGKHPVIHIDLKDCRASTSKQV